MPNLKNRVEKLEQGLESHFGIASRAEEQEILNGFNDSLKFADHEMYHNLERKYGKGKVHTICRRALDEVARGEVQI